MKDIYCCLLRGINVGGNNIIKMTTLKDCFERMDLKDVTTYIQSGNVVFSLGEKSKEKLTNKIEKHLSEAFKYKSRVAVITHDELRNVITKAPKGFGKEPIKFRYDVIFLLQPLSTGEAVKQIPLKPGVDWVFAGPGVIYASRLISKAAQSHISRLIQKPVYQQMTIRNWNTTTKLLAIMDANID